MKNTVRIGFYNNKGGVGKTTTVINVTHNLAKSEANILVVDCDSQMNCFYFLSPEKKKAEPQPTKYPNVFNTTWQCYAKLTETDAYSHILFDLPPSMSDEVREIIGHCGTIFIPTKLGEFESRGIGNVIEEIQRQKVRLGGVFTTMYRKGKDFAARRDFETVLKSRFLQTVVPFSDAVGESQKLELTIEDYFLQKDVPAPKDRDNPHSAWKIVHAYEDLTKEIIGRCL